MNQESAPTVDKLVARTAEQVIRMSQSGGVHGDLKPAVERMLQQLVVEAREAEMQTALGYTIRPIQAVAVESVIDVLRTLDFAPILISPEANGRYIWRWMESEGIAPSFLTALREVLHVAVVGVLPSPQTEEE